MKKKQINNTYTEKITKIVDLHYNAITKAIEAHCTTAGVQKNTTEAIITDLGDMLYNTYTGFTATLEDVKVILEHTGTRTEWAELGSSFLDILLEEYSDWLALSLGEIEDKDGNNAHCPVSVYEEYHRRGVTNYDTLFTAMLKRWYQFVTFIRAIDPSLEEEAMRSEPSGLLLMPNVSIVDQDVTVSWLQIFRENKEKVIQSIRENLIKDTKPNLVGLEDYHEKEETLVQADLPQTDQEKINTVTTKVYSAITRICGRPIQVIDTEAQRKEKYLLTMVKQSDFNTSVKYVNDVLENGISCILFDCTGAFKISGETDTVREYKIPVSKFISAVTGQPAREVNAERRAGILNATRLLAQIEISIEEKLFTYLKPKELTEKKYLQKDRCALTKPLKQTAKNTFKPIEIAYFNVNGNTCSIEEAETLILRIHRIFYTGSCRGSYVIGSGKNKIVAFPEVHPIWVKARELYEYPDRKKRLYNNVIYAQHGNEDTLLEYVFNFQAQVDAKQIEIKEKKDALREQKAAIEDLKKECDEDALTEAQQTAEICQKELNELVNDLAAIKRSNKSHKARCRQQIADWFEEFYQEGVLKEPAKKKHAKSGFVWEWKR